MKIKLEFLTEEIDEVKWACYSEIKRQCEDLSIDSSTIYEDIPSLYFLHRAYCKLVRKEIEHENNADISRLINQGESKT